MMQTEPATPEHPVRHLAKLLLKVNRFIGIEYNLLHDARNWQKQNGGIPPDRWQSGADAPPELVDEWKDRQQVLRQGLQQIQDVAVEAWKLAEGVNEALGIDYEAALAQETEIRSMLSDMINATVPMLMPESGYFYFYDLDIEAADFCKRISAFGSWLMDKATFLKNVALRQLDHRPTPKAIDPSPSEGSHTGQDQLDGVIKVNGIGGLQINTEFRQIQWGTKLCDLDNRPTVFKLFERLHLTQDKRIKFATLLDDVWDGRVVDNTTIASTACALRAALRKSKMDDLAERIEEKLGTLCLRSS